MVYFLVFVWRGRGNLWKTSQCPQLIFRLGPGRCNLNMSLLELACLLGYGAGCEQLTGGKVLMALAYVCGW
jgi:hypothetical protein